MARRPHLPGVLSALRSRPERVASDQIYKSGAGGFGGVPGGVGPAGAPGRDAGFRYTYLTDTAATDPGVGNLKFNSTTFASITTLRISETDGDGNTLFNFLATVDDPASGIKGHMLMRKVGSPGTFALFSITGALTDNGTWDSLVVALVLSAGAFNNNDAVMLNFLRTGDKGDAGPAGGAGPSGGPLPAARLATTAALPAYTRTGNVLLANVNGALPTIDGVAPAVNDLVLLVNGAAGADNGVYTVDSLGSGAAKWQMTRYASMDTSAELVPGMLVTVAEGNANADTTWQLTTNAPITLNTTALTFVRKPKEFGPVTALPANPVTGDLCTYMDSLSAPTYRWRLQYNGNSSSAYKWECIGGSPMTARADTARTITSATYADVPTDTMQLTTPLAGDWEIEIQGLLSAGAAGRLSHSYSVGATAASVAWCAYEGEGTGTGYAASACKTIHTSLASGQAIREKAFATTATGAVEDRRLYVMPVRVG